MKRIMTLVLAVTLLTACESAADKRAARLDMKEALEERASYLYSPNTAYEATQAGLKEEWSKVCTETSDTLLTADQIRERVSAFKNKLYDAKYSK